MSEDEEVLFNVERNVALITLNRPKALNALTLNMVRLIHAQLIQWAEDEDVTCVIIRSNTEKAFCAGGDIRALYDWGLAKDPRFIDFYRDEYLLNRYIKRYPKPYIALLDGVVMGGGVGVSVHGTHRIAGDNILFAMPETGIGLFPDVGGTFFLPRCPGETGMYLGLSGARLKTADTLYCGIATNYIPSNHHAGFLQTLIEGEELEKAINDFAKRPEKGSLETWQNVISEHFGKSNIDEVFASLGSTQDEWAQKTLKILQGKSPTSLKITFRQLREGATADFEKCMQIEYRIVNRIFHAADFFEGTRAVVIDKDQMPKWSPENINEVSDQLTDSYFEPLDKELVFS